MRHAKICWVLYSSPTLPCPFIKQLTSIMQSFKATNCFGRSLWSSSLGFVLLCCEWIFWASYLALPLFYPKCQELYLSCLNFHQQKYCCTVQRTNHSKKYSVLQFCTQSAPLSTIIIILSAQFRRAKQPHQDVAPNLPLLHYMPTSLLLQKILTTGWAVAALCM